MVSEPLDMSDQAGVDQYQQGFYDGVSKARETVAELHKSYTADPLLEAALSKIDALLHAPPAD